MLRARRCSPEIDARSKIWTMASSLSSRTRPHRSSPRAGSAAAAGGPGSWFPPSCAAPSSAARNLPGTYQASIAPLLSPALERHVPARCAPAPDRSFFTVSKDRIAVPDRYGGCHHLGHHVAKDCLEGERIAVNEPRRQFLVLGVDVDPNRSAEICLELPGAPVNVPRRAFLRLPAKCRRELNKLDRKARVTAILEEDVFALCPEAGADDIWRKGRSPICQNRIKGYRAFEPQSRGGSSREDPSRQHRVR